ncbi:MAG: hypothetical protein JO108_18185 [Acidobacteriaceae bacterium]|nr:hypothetical protein [Acidobacteriaceae bacterium]
MASKSWDKKSWDAAIAVETESTPDRTQCPPDERIRALAKGELSGKNLLQQHVEECEWCAREYKDHARDPELNRLINRSTKAIDVVILAIIIFEIVRHFSQK